MQKGWKHRVWPQQSYSRKQEWNTLKITNHLKIKQETSKKYKNSTKSQAIKTYFELNNNEKQYIQIYSINNNS